MGSGMIARTSDYLWLLVEASAWTLLSAVVTDICVKFKQRRLARIWVASFFGSALVAVYCLEKLL
jgi:hypothetical protein